MAAKLIQVSPQWWRYEAGEEMIPEQPMAPGGRPGRPARPVDPGAEVPEEPQGPTREEILQKLEEAKAEAQVKWQEIKGKIAEVLPVAADNVKAALVQLQGRLEEGWQKLQTKFDEIKADLGTRLPEDGEIKDKLAVIKADIKTALTEAKNTIQAALPGLTEELKAKLELIGEKLQVAWANLQLRIQEITCGVPEPEPPPETPGRRPIRPIRPKEDI